jgi:hypothetical protein
MVATWNEGCLGMSIAQAKRPENGRKRNVERSLRRRFDADLAAKPH